MRRATGRSTAPRTGPGAAHRRFHEELVRLCGNQTMVMLIGAVESVCSPGQRRGRAVAPPSRPSPSATTLPPAPGYDDHSLILAFIGGESEAAAREAQRHLQWVPVSPPAPGPDRGDHLQLQHLEPLGQLGPPRRCPTRSVPPPTPGTTTSASTYRRWSGPRRRRAGARHGGRTPRPARCRVYELVPLPTSSDAGLGAGRRRAVRGHGPRRRGACGAVGHPRTDDPGAGRQCPHVREHPG